MESNDFIIKSDILSHFYQLSLSHLRELIDSKFGNKPVRIEFLNKNIDDLKPILAYFGLSYSVSNKCFRITIDSGMDLWSSSLEDCSDSEPDAMRLVYLHPTQSICDKTKLLDEKNDDLHLGLELHYPECCVEAYCKWQTDNEDIDPITTITNAFSFDGALKFYDFPNPFSRYFGLGLYSHFPCSLTCQATKQVAKKSLDNLQTHFLILADKLIQYENSFVIFQKEEGVCIWNRFSIDNNKIQLDKQSFHGQGKLKKILATIEEIELQENHLLIFSKLRDIEIYNTDSCFIGVFNFSANLQ